MPDAEKAAGFESLAEDIWDALDGQHDRAYHVRAAECCWPFGGSRDVITAALADAVVGVIAQAKAEERERIAQAIEARRERVARPGGPCTIHQGGMITAYSSAADIARAAREGGA